MTRRIRVSTVRKYRFRGSSGGSSPTPPAAPSISAFAFSDMAIDEDVSGTFTATIGGGTLTDWSLDPGDGSAPYTGSGGSISQAHTYADAGVYDATLTLTGPGGTSTPANVNDIIVTAAGGATSDWYDWAADFTSLSSTNRNLSGASKTAAPFTSLQTFHPGEVTTAHWFDADVGGTPLASNAWQLGQRTTYPDGSLASAILRAIIPGTWTSEADKTVTLTRKAGSWPAETDGRSISLVTSASDFWVELDDITRPENRPHYDFAARNSQTAWTNPTLEYRNNRALGLSTARTVSAGNVFRQDLAYEMLRTPDGSTADADLWVLCYTDTWFSPGTDTVIHQSVHPLLCHGYANAYVLAKVAKIRLMDGASEIHNYSDVLNLTMADWNFRSGSSEWDFTDASTDFSTFRFRAGDAVKITGDTPSNIPDGHLFQVNKTQDMGDWASNGRAGEITQLPYLGLCWKGVWKARGGVSGSGGGGNNMPPGSGGGDHTMTSYTLILDKTIMALRDDDGSEVWTVGGAQIEPCWTRAEKIRRMQTGQITSIPIDELPENEPPTTYQGLLSNAPKNTSPIPIYNHLHAYGPGRALYHRGELNTSGVYFSQGNHLNECSLNMFDVLNDMANPAVPFWRIQKQAAAESIAIVGMNCFDHNTVSGSKIAQPICLNNGPAKNGVAYSGMGPCQPEGYIGGAVKARGSGGGNDQQNEMSYYPALGDSGSHSPKDMGFGYVLRCYPTDLVGIQNLWSLVAVKAGFVTPSPALYGRNKNYDGVNYYMSAMIGTSTSASAQPRVWIGWNHYLSFCLYTPDSEPASQYFKDVVADSVNYFSAIIDDTDIFGQRAKVVGMIQSGVGNQAWVLGRHCHVAAILLKRSGIVGTGPEKVLNFLTAMSRCIIGAPEGGGTPWMQATGDGYTGWTGFVNGFVFFDKGDPEITSPTSTDPRACVVRWLDDASSVTDGSVLYLGHDVAGETAITFNTDNTVTWANSEKFVATHMPTNDDQVLFGKSPAGETPPPTSVPKGQPMWLYDFSGTTCKISTTPGPSYTQLTWSIGSPVGVHRNNVSLNFATRRAGAYANGLVGIMQNTGQAAVEYIYETEGVINAAYTMFGAAFLEDAIDAYDTFRARAADVSQGGHSFFNRAQNSGSWAMLEHYGPGAT